MTAERNSHWVKREMNRCGLGVRKCEFKVLGVLIKQTIGLNKLARKNDNTCLMTALVQNNSWINPNNFSRKVVS